MIALLMGLPAVQTAWAAADPVPLIFDTRYIVTPRPDGMLPGVRVVFFSELGWGQGGQGQVLRDKIVRSLKAS